MRGLVRKAIVLALGMLTIADVAAAQVAALSNIGTGVTLTGVSAGGTSDPTVPLKTIFVADAGGPMVGALVTIDFAGCGPVEFHVCSAQPFPGMATGCPPAATVSAVTGPGGIASFRVVGSHSPPPGITVPCAVVNAVAGGPAVVLGVLRVSATDDGFGGVAAGDVARVLTDRVTSIAIGTNYTRSDFNGDASVGPADVAFMLNCRASTIALGTSPFSCAAVDCP